MKSYLSLTVDAGLGVEKIELTDLTDLTDLTHQSELKGVPKSIVDRRIMRGASSQVHS